MAIKVLFVDDEPHLSVIIQQAFRMEIRKGEFEFLFAENGVAALEVLEANPSVEAVFTDIRMPEMDGLTLLKVLNQRFPLLRTVIMTAYGDMASIRAAMNHGALDFLNKPLNLADLKITLRKTLAQVQMLRELCREKKQRYLAEKLRTLTETLSSTMSLTDVLKRFLALLAEVLPCAASFICLREGTRFQMTYSDGANRWAREPPAPALIETWFRQVRGAKKPLFGPHAETGELAEEPTGGEAGMVIFMPLLSKGETFGFVALEQDREHPFPESEREVVWSFVGQASFAIENARLFEDIRRLAVTDSLTGLFNRRHAFREAEKEFDRCRRYGNHLSAIMIDIDQFKNFNDRHGHLIGDEVLRKVAACLRQTCRKTDLSARFGGDEMLLLLIETDLTSARETAERLRKAVGQISFTAQEGTPQTVSISLGVASLDENTKSLDDLLNRADQMLYRAKNSGRNQIAYFDVKV